MWNCSNRCGLNLRGKCAPASVVLKCRRRSNRTRRRIFRLAGHHARSTAYPAYDSDPRFELLLPISSPVFVLSVPRRTAQSRHPFTQASSAISQALHTHRAHVICVSRIPSGARTEEITWWYEQYCRRHHVQRGCCNRSPGSDLPITLTKSHDQNGQSVSDVKIRRSGQRDACFRGVKRLLLLELARPESRALRELKNAGLAKPAARR